MLRRGGIPIRIVGATILGAALGGCAIFSKKPLPVVPPPAVHASVRQFAGTPLSGPTTNRAGDIDLDGSIRIDISWVALDAVPGTSLPPLDTQSRLTFSPGNSDAFLPTGMLTRAARFGTDSDAGQFSAQLNTGKLGKSSIASTQSALVAPGTTVQFDLADPPRGNAPIRRVSLAISRRPVPTTQPGGATTRTERATIAIRIDDYGRSRSDSGAAQSDRVVFGQEVALLDDVSISDGSKLALLVPMTYQGTPWRAVAAMVSAHAAGQADQSALAELRDNVDRSMAAARAATSRPTSEGGSDLSSAIAALGQTGGFRAPLSFLATQTGAAIAADFVLVADDTMLTKLADESMHFASSHSGPLQADKLGWEMDRSALSLMSQSVAKPDCPPGIIALLSLYAGEAGRHADSIQEVLKSVGDRKGLDQRLLAENLIFLEDNSPAARVRAFDWLNSRGKAPKGFDPLGNPKARRAAIDSALNPAGGTP